MAKNRNNVRIYGDDASAVYVAAKGSTAPTALAVPSTPWKELGWLSEDGVDFTQDVDSSDFRAHQGGAVIRQKVQGVTRKWKFQCLEETALVLGLVHPGIVFAETTTGSGIWKGTAPAGYTLTEMAWVVDEVDGAITKRYVVPTATAILTGTVSHKNSDLTVYEFELTSLGTFDILSNTAAWNPA